MDGYSIVYINKKKKNGMYARAYVECVHCTFNKQNVKYYFVLISSVESAQPPDTGHGRTVSTYYNNIEYLLPYRYHVINLNAPYIQLLGRLIYFNYVVVVLQH
jgi:hypothetical protein